MSYSAITDWRACPQRYWYGYVEKLRPKVQAPAPTLGRILHAYLAYYYSALSRRRGAHLLAHRNAVDQMEAEYTEECKQLSWTAASLGADDVAKEISELIPLSRRLVQAYYRVRGKQDAKDYKVLLVEQDISAPIIDGIELPGVADLVTQDKDGRTILWEHKSTGNVPTQRRRFRDLQTLIYVVLLEMSKGIKVDGIHWNYLRTTPPRKPEVLKSTNQLTRRKDLVTTHELYLEAITENKFKRADYKDEIARIKENEVRSMFPRMELAIVQSEDVLLRDFVLSAMEIQHARSDASYIPVRNVSPQCDWCPYVKLCEGALLAGDDETLKNRHFKVSEGRKQKNGTGTDTRKDDFSVLLTE